jgi:MFS family permease
MILSLGPLRNSRNYRLLYFGQVISFLGSMISYTAIPYQIYQLTKSSFLVGMVGSVQLVPLVLTGLYGGALADSMNRRKMLLIAEALLCLACLLLLINSWLPHPSVILIFVAAGAMSAFVGLHRPSMEALTPQIVSKDELTQVAALNSFRYSVGAIVGPSLGGVIIAQLGLPWAYGIDFLTFGVSLFCLYRLNDIPEVKEKSKASVSSIKEGIRYALSKPELVGTYLVDIIAMVFAMPTALFPALSEVWGGAKTVGSLYAAMPAGALLFTLFSGWTRKISRHGAAVILAAAGWGFAIAGLAFAQDLMGALFFLALAGASDAVSALYRSTIWNETVPSHYRGRLAGLEMLSYMTGPLLGNMRAGFMASSYGNFISIFWGGIICGFACLLCVWIFPRFWRYRSSAQSV